MDIRIAVIGAGIMGADHARIIAQELSGAVLQVVCDKSTERAQAIAEAFGAEVCDDPLATIARDDVDAVLIASPDQTHAALTLACIEAKKPVLCEKPLATTIDECFQVIKAEVASGRQWVQLGFMRRFDPAYLEMKAVLDSGSLGNAVMMHNFHRNVEAPANFTGSMAISNSAPHEFDVARFILDGEYSAISAFQPKTCAADGSAAPVFMVLETQAGQLVNIEINNNAAYGYDVRGELVAEQGAVSLNSPVHSRVDTRLQSLQQYAPDWRPRFAEAYRKQNQAWLAFIRSGEISPIASNSWDGLMSTMVAEAGVEALATGTRVSLDLPEKPALYNK